MKISNIIKEIDWHQVSISGLLLGSVLFISFLLFSGAVQAQTIVTRDYHAAEAPEHCWIYENEGIISGAIAPNNRGGIHVDLHGIVLIAGSPTPLTLVGRGEVGCKLAGSNFSCTEADDRTPLSVDNLPQVVTYCISSTSALNDTNAAGHAIVDFTISGQSDRVRIRHALVRSTNQMDYWYGKLPACRKVGHTGKSVIDGFIVCDKNKDDTSFYGYEPD